MRPSVPAGGPVGFIADDITGATDQASALAGRGFDTRLAFGSAVIDGDGVADADAVVVALKVRSVPAADARQATTEAALVLRAAGATRLFSKYCSTFDSTPEGNIGPIADALIEVTGAEVVVHCPAYPANGRTVYLGHLFVGDQLLSESPMRDHPLNPMRDARLTRVLGSQTARGVGLLPLAAIDRSAVAETLDRLRASGARHVIGDAVRDGDLETLAQAAAREPLAAGSAPFGAAFAEAARGQPGHPDAGRASLPDGPTAILVGSLSQATREQVKAADGRTLALRVEEMIDGDAALERMTRFVSGSLPAGRVLITTDFIDAASRSGPAGRVEDRVARSIEHTMGRMSVELTRMGVRRLIVAGGETSGAVATALGLRTARIGPDISVGVPWMVAEDRTLAIAFKSGNFGSASFFNDAVKTADA